MSLRDKIVEVAISQLGYTEGKNNDTKYGDWYGLPNQPWCAMFVSWCADQAGISQDIIKKFAYCPTGYNWFNSKGEATRSHITPNKGDIIFFIWSQGNTVPDHVGLVEYVEGSTVHTIEGNRSDKVQRFSYSIYDWRIFGYGQPNYGDSPEPPKPTGDETIRDIQSWLNNEYGTGLDVDGFYGPKTKKGLVIGLQTEFNRQFDAGLAVDGIFGPKTKQACRNIRKGAQGNITKLIQSALYCRGYNPNGIDGIFGSGTERAVKSFQSDNGLSVDGIVGKNTFEKLFK